jgi:replication factor C subunit 3/5
MALWCDKYRPTSLSKLDFGEEQGNLLKNLVEGGDFPHLLIYGPSGAGKKTRITCLLREIFGSSVEKLKIQHQIIETPSKKKLEVRTVASNFHIEINPSEAGHNDRVVIQELIKAHASTQVLMSETATSSSPLKVVVVSEADKLTKEAQQALRRTMEKYSGTCRLILQAEMSCRIIPAIKSRTLMVRVPAPSYDAIAAVIHDIVLKEGHNILKETCKQIAQASRRNLRRAIMMTETMIVTGDMEVIPEPRWKTYIKEVANMIMTKPNAYGIEEIRTSLYQLQAHMIPTEMIFEFLVRELLSHRIINSQNSEAAFEAKVALVNLAAYYENQCRNGSKSIIHLEAFIAQFIASYKSLFK